MTHTVESLMSLATQYHEATINWVASGEPTAKARAALQSALTEVLADLEKHRELLVKHLAVIDPLRAELALREAECSSLQIDKELLWAKVAAMEKQEPIGYVFDDDENIYTGSVIRRNQIDGYVPVYLAPGAAPDMTRDHYWSKVDARCKELEAKVAEMESQLAQANGMAAAWKLTHDAVLTSGAAQKQEKIVASDFESVKKAQVVAKEKMQFFNKMAAQAAPAAHRLSDAECAELIDQHFFPDMRPDFQHYRAFRRAIEAAFAEKNGITLEQKHD